MREQFNKLMKAFCLLVKLPDAQPFIEGASFDVDGTNCAILFNEKVDANRCFVYADFGQPPPENETQVFYELLRQNLAAAADTRTLTSWVRRRSTPTSFWPSPRVWTRMCDWTRGNLPRPTWRRVN